MTTKSYILIPCLSLFFTLLSCTKEVATPKPYGYIRCDLPQHTYRTMDFGPYAFELSSLATFTPQNEEGEEFWGDITYPTLNATIHCSYKKVKRGKDLPELTEDAMRFVYRHSAQATSIPEHDFANEEQRVYGVLFNLEGNTASPTQFFLTDSLHHFFRGALYFNTIPNADSLAPMREYLNEDILNLIETFRWTH